MSEPLGPQPQPAAKHPTAVVHSKPSWLAVRRPISHWWWVTAVCAVIAVALFLWGTRARGPRIWVRFLEGHGIQPGDHLRYRGIEVGEVTSVELADALKGVTITIRLDAAAAGVARTGSRFWIERPQVSLSRVRGLETVVGPKYIAVAPGPAKSERQRVFQGDESPVLVADARIEEITIYFANGHGLTIGDELRHRGIMVGEVTSVDLDKNLAGVSVRVRLASSASDLARAGTHFWVERPRIGFSGIRGLETIVGGRYLGVLPGPPNAPPRDQFTGLENAPVAVERVAGGLEIVLDSPHRYGVDAGAPLTHRGVEIGTILAVGLASDAASVELRAYVYPEYRSLVRDNTRFWSTSGIDLDIGVSGVHFSADTLATIAAGGVALATPETEGRVVSTGHRFQLLERPADESKWHEWRPRLAVGAAQLPEGAAVPRPLRGLFLWHKRTLGIRRQQQQEGWVLALDNGRIVAPANMLLVPEGTREKQGTLEIAGQAFSLGPDQVSRSADLASTALELPQDYQKFRWPASAVRRPAELEDALLLWGTRERSTPLPAARMSLAESRWRLDASLPISADAHGAPVISANDGAVIGLLVISDNQPFVAPIPETLLTQ